MEQMQRLIRKFSAARLEREISFAVGFEPSDATEQAWLDALRREAAIRRANKC
jgi:hypothetical protein